MNARLTACLAALVGPVLHAQGATWVEGPRADDLNVLELDRVVPPASPQVVLRQVELMPIEITNRTAQQALRHDVARLAAPRGVRRIALPDGGSLFAYRRGGGVAWGFLHARADGGADVVLERAGAGATGRESPFADRIAVAPDGRHAAVPLVNGALLAVRLDGGTFASTGAAWRPITLPSPVETTTVCAGASQVFCGTDDDRVFRCAWTDGAAPVERTPTLAGARLKSEFAPAVDGRSVVFLYGVRPNFGIYQLGETGAARRLSAPAAKYEEPGYLPEFVGGPRLLLSDDGSRLFYVDSTVRDESFLLDTTGATSTTHVTSNANFQPYIGVVILPFAIGGIVVTGIGDPQAFDVYSASTASPNVTNLTQTNGNTVAPFATGGIVPRAMTAVGSAGMLLESAPSGGGVTSLRQLGAVSRVIVPDVTSPLTRSAGWGRSPDFHVGGRDGDRLLDGADASVWVWAPPGIALARSVVAADGLRVVLASGGAQRALLLRLASGELIGIAVGADTREAVLTRGGELLINSGSELRWFDPRGSWAVSGSSGYRLVLSGQGTG